MQSTTVNDIGFVRDYGDMKEFGKYLDDNYDHRHLNNIVDCNPTAENMCVLLFNKFASTYPELVAVRISETPRTWAEYRAN
jgi:6-pyruvoyltetrahydropterin/6-carboxytetrahydropterin synthase